MKGKNKMNKRNKAGRPRYTPTVPNGKFTFGQFCEANGMTRDADGNYSGGKCTPLTLRHFLRDQKNKGSRSEVVVVKGVTKAPNGESGLGRKAMVYIRRSKQAAINKAKRTVKVQVNATSAAPASAPVETAPEVAAPVAVSVETEKEPVIA